MELRIFNLMKNCASSKSFLSEGPYHQLYDVELELAVRATEFSKLILKYEPAIVHFSGHGSPDGHLYLENETGEMKTVIRMP